MTRSPLDEIIRVQEEYYVLASSARVNEETRVLKHGDTFGVFDRHGDIHPVGLREQGLYHDGTRYLSELELRLDGRHMSLLSSTVLRDNAKLVVDLTNPDLDHGTDDTIDVPRGTIHVFRSRLLWESVLYEQVRITNYAMHPVEFTLQWRFDADFVDLFEVRGVRRARRGRRLDPELEPAAVTLGYEGLDGRIRRTRIELSPAPARIGAADAECRIRLDGKAEVRYFVSVTCLADDAEARPLRFEDAGVRARTAMDAAREAECQIETSCAPFNRWLDQSMSDLHMMLSDTPYGVYPFAGVPWFCTPFGRDGLITALAWLWSNPAVARGVLGYLAARQAREVAVAQDAEPGKILHEVRGGEMAALGETPFAAYYGSVDSTSLFVILAAAYYRRTGDRHLIEQLWPHLEAALDWHERYGDADGDGFIDYARRTPDGLVHQGWKDSHDSVFHGDGVLAEGPIALCEVQGYYHAALRGAASLAAVLGKPALARRLTARADDLRVRFDDAFWDDELSMYALALDGAKRPCRVRSSNAGQCLFTGIVRNDRARRIADGLLSPAMFSGWGVRTLASNERRYNPLSYHNGSIWPHDNALVALGLARHGLMDHAMAITGALLDVSTFVDQHRLPELFCGLVRRPGEGPTAYPVACNPQAWAASSVLMLLEACLGMTIDAPARRIVFRAPALPALVDQVRIRGLRVAEASVDLIVERHRDDVTVLVMRRDGPCEIELVK
jgi:glycogen debranching enzyme